MDNATRRQLLQRHKQSGFTGSILDVYNAYDQGVDLIGQFEQQNNIGVAESPQQQQQGLRPAHQAGDINKSMVFPNVPPNTTFNTEGMKAPINIEKYDEQGHLVKSYENVPPGVRNLPTGPQRGTVIETPTKMQFGGQVDNTRVATPQPPQYQYQLNPPPQSPYRDQGTITPDKSSFNAWRDEDSLFENTVEFFDPTGITSWDDARRAYNSMKNRGASTPNLDEGLDMFGAIPLFGKANLGVNLAKGAAKRPKDVVNATKKGYNYLTKGSDIINRVDAVEDEVGFLDPKQRGTVIETPDNMQAGGFNDTMRQYANMYNKFNPEGAVAMANMPERTPDRLTSYTDAEMTRNENRQNARIDQASLNTAKDVAGNVVQYHKDKPLDALGMDLAVLGQVPLVGEVADLANAGISGARGIYNTAVGDTAKAKEQFTLAGLSAASAIPFAGNAMGAARIAKAGHNISHKAHTLEKGVIGAKAFNAGSYEAPAMQAGGPRKLQNAGWKNSYIAESTAQPSFAEQAFLNQQNALPALPPPRYRDEGTIREGNFQVDEGGMIVEDRPSFLEMAANPIATARAINNPAVEGLPSQVEFDQSKAKGSMIGQITNDFVNPFAMLNYGVNAYKDFGQATNYALQGEGQKALQSVGSGLMNTVGAVPGYGGVGRAAVKGVRKAGVAAVDDLYKLNPYLKNPMGFRNVGDNPHFLFGYNKPIDPRRMDLSPQAGFDELLGKRNSIEQQFGQKFLKRKDLPRVSAEREADLARLYKKTPFEPEIGGGSFGTVHPIKGTDDVIKIGKSDLPGEGLPGSRYSGMTDDFIDRASELSHLDNVALPRRSGTIPQRNYGQPQTLYDFSYQPVVPKTELTVMKGLDTSADFGFTGIHAGRDPGSLSRLAQPSRDQFASALKKIRQMRDKGIGVDLDNPANIRFNRETGNFNLYDLENMPQLAAKNARELEQLSMQHGPMVPYPNSPMSPQAHGGQLFKDPSEYMQEARIMLGRVAGGIPNKHGLRFIDNFQNGGRRRQLQRHRKLRK